jgi:tetratricopeptide (TPR) repeat protein
LILGLLALTLWNLARNTASGICGAWYFLILAPTSSILPISDLAAERRMYLPLAGVLTLLVCLAYRALARVWSRRTAAFALSGAVLALAVLLGVATVRRNLLYADELTMWRDVLSQAPNNPRALSFVGKDELAQGHLDAAEALFRHAVATNPASAVIHCRLGELLLVRKQNAQAEAEFREALHGLPNYELAWKGLSDALLAQGRAAEALSALEQGTLAAPDSHDLNVDFAQKSFNAGHFEDAVRAYSTAVRLSPKSSDLHNSLGSALASAGHFPEALREFDAALQYAPNHPLALYNRGNVSELMGNRRDAAADYRAAAAADPQAPAPLNALAWLAVTFPGEKLGTPAEALALAERACALTQFKTPIMLDTLAATCAANGDFAKAASVEVDALKLLPPEHPLARDIAKHLELFKTGKPLVPVQKP